MAQTGKPTLAEPVLQARMNSPLAQLLAKLLVTRAATKEYRVHDAEHIAGSVVHQNKKPSHNTPFTINKRVCQIGVWPSAAQFVTVTDQ